MIRAFLLPLWITLLALVAALTLLSVVYTVELPPHTHYHYVTKMPDVVGGDDNEFLLDPEEGFDFEYYAPDFPL